MNTDNTAAQQSILSNLLEVLADAAVMSIFSILILGWLTSLVGAILGGLYAYFLQKRKLLE